MQKAWIAIIGLPIAWGAYLVSKHEIQVQFDRQQDAFDAKIVNEARTQLTSGADDDEKCSLLTRIAKDDVNRGKIREARDYATKALAIGDRLAKAGDKGDGSGYGIAVHDGNVVLGRIALKEGRVEEAKADLLKAGTTPGYCTLDSFGPNMRLAKELLDRGERKVVLDYFQECRKFWGYHADKLDHWTEEVKNSGNVDDFGANLVY